MSRLVFLLEERSMKSFLENLLPRVLPALEFHCVPHEGKNDLERSIPRKLRAWQEPGVRFVVVRDNDGGDCAALKEKVVGLCEEGRRPDTLVRIACQELEAWYFGNLDAVADAYGRQELRGLGRRARYRNPDQIVMPSRELQKLVPEFQKISGARQIGALISPEENSSRSFRVFIQGIRRLASEPS